uniref:PPPDE domain-containing protein n=1 Tax=Tetraselmis chuii TaxID=63592 RepID=A0A7S1SMJ2_9CHLO|mmetsp:Transcript_15786/g.28021  ORF Transcript_15786/g.28021 Transcript_15786/m.28021 type:complete len:251 (+) Transcript_15786:378-1130(+)
MEVTLHIYDVTNTTNEQANAVIMRVNNVTRDFAMGGVFHGAVEVNGKEWSYGYCDAGSGVYACLPKLNPQYTYRESIPMGVTALSLAQINEVLQELRQDWAGNMYDLLGRNCCHFSEEFCKLLGVGPVPAWVNRFACGAESAVNVVQATVTQIQWLGASISNAWTSAVSAASALTGPEPPHDQGVLTVVDDNPRPPSRPHSSSSGKAGSRVGAVPAGAGINSPAPARRTLGPRLSEARVASEEPITWTGV